MHGSLEKSRRLRAAVQADWLKADRTTVIQLTLIDIVWDEVITVAPRRDSWMTGGRVVEGEARPAFVGRVARR